MKRVLGIILVALMFASCASKGWSCKKRYVNTDYKQYTQECVASVGTCEEVSNY